MTVFSQFTQYFYDKIKTLNPNVVPEIEGTNTFFIANAVAQICSQVVQDITREKNAIIPYAGSGSLLDASAASLGMTPRMPSQSSTGIVNQLVANSGLTANATFTIPINTLLTNQVNGEIYFVTQSINVAVNTSLSGVTLPIQSQSLGSISYSPPSSELIFNSPIQISGAQELISASLLRITPGANVEKDQELSIRIFDYMESPRGGGSSGDYKTWAFAADSSVTKVVVITAFSQSLGVLYPVIFQGSNNYNYYIDNNIAFPISRMASNATLANVSTYVEGRRAANDNPEIITCLTYGLKATDTVMGTTLNALNVAVTLIAGISLTTLIPVLSANFTVEELIKREIRRGVIATSSGGTEFDLGLSPDYYISVSSLEEMVMAGLASTNTLNGLYASLVTSINISFTNSLVTDSKYIRIPSVENGKILNTALKGAYMAYDIDNTIISISLAT